MSGRFCGLCVGWTAIHALAAGVVKPTFVAKPTLGFRRKPRERPTLHVACGLLSTSVEGLRIMVEVGGCAGGSGITFTNPNEITSCSCGKSFG
jgi:hypothetical protein